MYVIVYAKLENPRSRSAWLSESLLFRKGFQTHLQIQHFVPSKEGFTIDISGLNKGIYLLELKTNLSTLAEKVMIEQPFALAKC